MVGGLKATILTDWIHTFILIVIIIIFSLTAYARSDVLGSPAAVYDALVAAAQTHPVDGNKDGSYLVRILPPWANPVASVPFWLHMSSHTLFLTF